jgi:hypothetical protein
VVRTVYNITVFLVWKYTRNGVGIYKEQNRMRQDYSKTPGNRQNGLGIHQEFRNEPGVHKEWWGPGPDVISGME